MSGAKPSAVSGRMRNTDTPCIVTMQQSALARRRTLATSPHTASDKPPLRLAVMRGKSDVLSLAQGIVHWSPPAEATAAASAAVALPETSRYGADDGMPELREALKRKLAAENGLVNSEVMVTAGANQAYTNLVLTLLDAGDAAALFRPYYFNHLMALQMTGSAAELFLPPSTAELQPDLAALRAEMQARAASGRPPLRMVTMSNPGNPTGVMIPEATIREASALCKEHGAWLVMDNTYEHFSYPGEPPHACVEADHVINVFSFSKVSSLK